MEKTLVVVESPAKARTIARYLGKDYHVLASVGHIRDLPASTIGVDINNGFKPMYLTLPGKDKVVRELKDASLKADRVLLATDPDREGAAIAWHLAQLLKVATQGLNRIVF
ncbi:MAG: toprim domain-containing protein, partial [Clostridiaceae bacterium]|nr:toprim domain-containing protein [Clostridiaceae bacterium]